jgi:hypothetical protein
VLINVENGGTYLARTLKVLDVVALNVVVTSDRLPQFDSDDHSRSLRRWSSGKEHDPGSSVGERGLGGASARVHGRMERELTSRSPTATLIATPVHR